MSPVRPVGMLRGRFSHLAGSMSSLVLEEVDIDAVLENVDVSALLDRIDVNAVVDRIEINELLNRVNVDDLMERIDVQRLLARVDPDILLASIDVTAIVDRIDVERVVARLDLQELVRRAGIPDVVADSTGQLAGSALALARRELVGIDIGLSRALQRLLRRDPDALPPGPPTLVARGQHFDSAPDPETSRLKARTQVSGFYAGPVTRFLAFWGDVALASALFTAGAAGVSWLLATVLRITLPTSDQRGVLWIAALAAWLFTYWGATSAVAGRTPAMLLTGLRIVARDGSPLRPRTAFVRTLLLPLSLVAFGAGAAWMLIDRERRALHDVLAGSAVVYDWGGRPAEMPTPLARWIEVHGGGTTPTAQASGAPAPKNPPAGGIIRTG